MQSKEEKQIKDLLEQIMPWWKNNGWNPLTLQKKPLSALLRIRQRMLEEAFKPKNIKNKTNPKEMDLFQPYPEDIGQQKQIYNFDPLNDDGYGFEEND